MMPRSLVRGLAALLLLLVPVIGHTGEATRVQVVGTVPDLATIPLKIPATATASAVHGNGSNAPARAVDGRRSTRWESPHGVDPAWLTLDLGAVYTLDRVVIEWEAANAETYEIQGSNDNSSWTTLATQSGGAFGDRTDALPVSGSYRYVRMYGQERSSPYGYSTWEMEVYGVVPLIADSDSDGVDDSIDQCPGTETDTPVQSDGCEYGVYGGYESPTSYPGYDLVWSDEFDGNALNLADWTHEIGDGCNIGLCGWGNNENQYYKAENTVVSNGVLVIEARLEDAGNRNYTSSRIKTQGKQSFQYGRIDIRAVLPSGNGPWPALWMLGESISSVGWPRCGEVDIMEKRGGDEDTLLGTAHWYAENVPVNASYGGETDLPSGTFADEFHVFSIVWDATRIRWYLDDSPTPYHVISITPASLSEFRDEFFFVFNIAIGGTLGGIVDDAIFPQQMIVDYVRIFQQQ